MALLTPFSLEDARRVGAEFGLDVETIEPLSQGSVNSNFRLVCKSHAGRAAQYFARIYEEQDAEGAATELAILSTLAKLGIPTTEPVLRVEGGHVALHAGKPVSVYPWIGGESLCQRRVTPEWTRRLGRELARVHLASSHLPRIPAGRFGTVDMIRRLDAIERETSSFAEPVRLIRRKLDQYVAERRDDLPSGLIHGDLFRDNVLVQGDDIVALIDFESACRGTFAFDVMVCVHAWCFGSEFDAGLVRGLFQGYGEERPLSPWELQALRVEGAIAALRFATTRITDFSLRAEPGKPPIRDYGRFLARLESLESGVLSETLRALGSQSP